MENLNDIADPNTSSPPSLSPNSATTVPKSQLSPTILQTPATLPVPNSPIPDPTPAVVAQTAQPATLAPQEATQTPSPTANQIPSGNTNDYYAPWETASPPTPAPAETTAPVSTTPPPPQIPTGPKKSIFGKGPIFLGVLALLIILAGGAGFLGVKTFILDKVTTLDLIPDDAMFYLSLSVKSNPQAVAAKDLVKKFPGGEKVITSLDKQISDSLSSSTSPFDDFLRLSKNELFLTQISKADKDPSGYSTTQNIISFTDLLTASKAQERLDKFGKDDANVVKEKTYNGQKYLDLHLKEAEKSASPVNCNKTSTKQGTVNIPPYTCPPKPPTIFAAAINRFIVAGPKEDDIKKISDLNKLKASFGLSNQKKLKSIKDDSSHQAISRFFPSQTFLKYYSNSPLTPTNGFLPATGLTQSYLGISSNDLTNPEEGSKTAEHVITGVDVVAEKDGFQIDTLQLDTSKTKSQDLKNPFSLSDSLADQIPQTLNGITPSFYAETRNLKQIIQDQVDKIKDLSENSESRNQRKGFEEALKSWEDYKKSVKTSTNLDFDSDILSWLDGQNAMLFNAGSAKVSPEFLILAAIKDQSKVESSLKKLAIPDYASQARDYARQSDLRSISSALQLYFNDTFKYPTSLKELTTSGTVYIRTLPKDPKTGADYSYTSDGASYTLKTTLEDGRTYTIQDGDSSFTGTKSTTTGTISPKAADYSGTKIYTLELYSYNTIKVYFIFAVTNKKAILAFATNDKSVKELIDFESKGGTSLLQSQNWKDQFSHVHDKIAGFAYLEPIQFWGLVDYTKANYPTMTNYLTSDTETAFKAYLKTLKSIGTVVTKKKPVYSISTFAKIVELSSEEKKKAEDAVNKLINQDQINNYTSVLGISTNQDYTKENLKDNIINSLRGKLLP